MGLMYKTRRFPQVDDGQWDTLGNGASQKLTLTKLAIQLLVPECIKNNPQMILMLLLRLGVDQNVVNKDHNGLIQIGLEYSMHEIHECRWRIRQPIGHHYELEMDIPHSKRCLRDISHPNSELMVSGAKIHLGVHLCPSQLIK